MCIKYPHAGICTDHKRRNMKKYVYVLQKKVAFIELALKHEQLNKL